MYSDLIDLFASTSIQFPTVGKVRSHQNQFYISNIVTVITYDSSYSFSSVNKIKFVFRVEMNWKIKIILYSLIDKGRLCGRLIKKGGLFIFNAFPLLYAWHGGYRSSYF